MELQRAPVSNRLLAAVGDQDREEIVRRSIVVPLAHLANGRMRARYAYFPLSGVTSTLTLLNDGSGGEAALIGNEGVVGATLLPEDAQGSQTVMVHSTGEALAIPRDELRSLVGRSLDLLQHLAVFSEVLFRTSALTSVCNRAHRLDQRLARWILSANDRVHDGQPLLVTHESLALILGVRRPSVTMSLAALQDQGGLAMRRGRVSVARRAWLERLTCECYFAGRDLVLRQFD